MTTYVSKRFLDVIKNCADGCQTPLKNSGANQVVKVHRDEILSGPERIQAECRRDQLAKCNLMAMAVETEREGVWCFLCQIVVLETCKFLIVLLLIWVQQSCAMICKISEILREMQCELM